MLDVFLGIEVKAERLLEELDNGVLLCQLIDVLQNMVKACSSEEPEVRRCWTAMVLYLGTYSFVYVHFLLSLQGCKLPPQLFIRPWIIYFIFFRI